MSETTSTNHDAAEPTLLGPFLGHVTTSSIKIWLHLERQQQPIVYVTLHKDQFDAPAEASGTLEFQSNKLFTDCVTISELSPNTKYFYKLWTNPAQSIPLSLEGLTEKELHFRTLSGDPDEQVDFVVMSCHNPTVSQADGFDGHAVWADLPQIIGRESNKKVRFALLVGDQVYADDWQDRVLNEESEDLRLRHYLSAYRRFWSNIHYRRVMCSLPSVMMWDDHDITDGWGSEEKSFEGNTSVFQKSWLGLFDAAFKAFSLMQSSRNPPPLTQNTREGLDFCFKVGKFGFVFMDLRTNRNLRLRRLLTGDQAYRIRRWVEENRLEMHALFVVSPVVFSHGSPVVEDLTIKAWPFVMWIVDVIARWSKWGKGLQTKFGKSLGDIRDDIRDSWGSEENAGQTDELLNFLFELQNREDHPLRVVILSGDIHTSGYANIYSSDPKHALGSSIPHITSSSISYAPFNWLLEAVYRQASKSVALGTQNIYSSQISHHFCSRSVSVLSLRPHADGNYQLKVKYYLEGYPEPQILMFDLRTASHRENVAWVAQDKLFTKEYSPTANIDIEAMLIDRAKSSTIKLNWKESIVDLMKLLDLDSSLGARKQLALAWGYTGTLNGSKEMNIWLHQQMIKRIRESGGKVPDNV